MEHDFWLQRWREGETGFHQARVLPLLQKHWPAVGVPRGGRVFVPLAGKSLDMLWLAEQGHRVLGVELSPVAVEQFFAEQHLTPAVHASRYGTHHVAGPIELICGDAFGLDEAVLADCAGVYDRAALIALPPALRQQVEAGGTALLAADAQVPADAVLHPLWRDETGETLIEGGALGRGRLLRFARPLQAQAMPQLLDAQFPQRLRELLQATPSEPARADARSHAPQTGARSYATPPRELQPWLALLIALLFALERLLATQARRGAPA